MGEGEEAAHLREGDDEGKGVHCDPLSDGLGLRDGVEGKGDVVAAGYLETCVTGGFACETEFWL